MSDWWSYRPRDFLMFAPRTYWRLFEMHNDAWWPLPLWGVAAGLAAVVWLWLRPGRPALRAALGLAAAAWALVGWAFVWQRYAPISSAAWVFAVGFGLQAALLGGLALFARWPGAIAAAAAGRRGWLGAALFVWALLGQPLLAAAAGRPGMQAELFASAPDPTAIATLGLLLLMPRASPRWVAVAVSLVWALAIAWCAISAATLWTMDSLQAGVPTAAALIALMTAWSGRRARPRRGA